MYQTRSLGPARGLAASQNSSQSIYLEDRCLEEVDGILVEEGLACRWELVLGLDDSLGDVQRQHPVASWEALLACPA